jgi:hypothetical protein
MENEARVVVRAAPSSMEESRMDEEVHAPTVANESNGCDDVLADDESDDFGPILRLSLEEDLHRKDQLFSFRRGAAPAAAPAPTPFRPNEQQLLQQGKLGESEFYARLKKVVFGSYEGQSACLILIQLDFCPKNRGWFRFRDAVVEVGFEEYNTREKDSVDEYHGPTVRKFYPESIRGHVQNAAEKYGIKLSVPSPPTAASSAEWSWNQPKEGFHLIHGVLTGGDSATGVKWRIGENEVSQGGIYETPKLCVVLRHSERRFDMSLKMKTTTYGGRPILGKGGSRITITPPLTMKSPVSTTDHTEPVSPGLDGASVAMGKRTWTGQDAGICKSARLEEEDLEQLTQMRAVLLSPQGPGAKDSATSKAP